ncbi:MAG: UDP-N-acetylglucosamine acyltransferase [Puniceicoccaceae bacterium 5H]|nr:MAG: UDP-N-acetylglucosamine acyltransferase [Puniceicoccaceae bacterium 5H]
MGCKILLPLKGEGRHNRRMSFHSTAVIHEATRIDPSVTIGPYAVIEDGVELGAGCVIEAHAMVRSGSVLGEGCHVFPHAVVGGPPQDLRFDPKTPSGVRLGNRVTVREGVTIHRATQAGQFTWVEDEAFLMAYSHVAHDCRIGPHAILANNVMMGGFVEIGAHAFIGGGAALHQFIRIGESVMVSGVSRLTRDVPPFCLVAERDELSGFNLIGLKRRGFGSEVIRELKKLYRAVYFDGGNPKHYAEAARNDHMAQTPEGTRFLEFFAGGKRGFVRPERRLHATEDDTDV